MRRRKQSKEPGHVYVKAMDDLEVIEKKMARLFNAWVKAKAKLRRANAKLDEIQLVNFEPVVKA
jgi:hypothetical protein